MTDENIILFTDKSECCGCTACFSVCPVQAIQMRRDEEGFMYPQIDKSICIRCHRCQKVCPLKLTLK